MRASQLRGSLMLTLTALIWGTAFVAQSVGLGYVGPFTLNGVRWLIGGLVLIPCILFLDRLTGRRPSFWGTDDPRQRKALLLGGVCCGVALGVASSVQQIGLAYTTVGKAGFITALYIVLVPLLGLFVRKRVAPQVWVSVGLAVIGMYLLCITDGFSIALGDALMLVSALCFALHILIVDHFAQRAEGVRLSCVQFLVSGLLCCTVMLFAERPALSSVLAAWWPIIYAGVFSAGIGYTLQVVAQKDMNPTVASLILSLESVFAVLAGWLLLDEALSLREIIGCVLVFIAILLAQLPARPRTKTAGGGK